jgi:hypothetical protein
VTKTNVVLASTGACQKSNPLRTRKRRNPDITYRVVMKTRNQQMACHMGIWRYLRTEQSHARGRCIWFVLGGTDWVPVQLFKFYATMHQNSRPRNSTAPSGAARSICMGRKCSMQSFVDAPPRCWTDRSFVLKAVGFSGKLIHHASQDLKAVPEVALRAVRHVLGTSH